MRTAVGLVLLWLACCLAPVVLVTGGLGLLSAIGHNPWPITAALALLITATTAWAGHRRRARPGRGSAQARTPRRQQTQHRSLGW